VCNRKAVISSLVSRQDLPMPVEDVLLTRSSSSSCSSDLPTPCDSSCHATVATATADVACDMVDVSDVSVTLPVPVTAVSSLTSAVDNNQTVSSLVSVTSKFTQ